MRPVYRPVAVFIGLRYFFSGQRSGVMVSFISTLAIAGLVLGVGLMIVVLSVMNGFDRELRQNILSVVPHLQLIHQSGVDNWPQQKRLIENFDQVSEVSPYVQVNALINRGRKARPLQLLGLSSEAIPSGIGAVLSSYALQMPAQNEILISKVIAEDLQIQLGQSISIIVPESKNRSATVHSFLVSGLFATRTELDQSLAIGSLSKISELAGIPDQIQGFRIQVEDQFNVRALGYDIIEKMPFGYGFRDWFQTHGNLYQAIQLSRNMVVLLVFLIVAVAAFNIVSMLMMSVINKRKDIAVLQTLGCSRAQIINLFLVQGTTIGIVGVSLGILLGLVGCYFVADVISWLELAMGRQFLDTQVYPIDYVPVDFRWTDALLVATVAFSLNSLATVYPALRASGTVPADELRYE